MVDANTPSRMLSVITSESSLTLGMSQLRAITVVLSHVAPPRRRDSSTISGNSSDRGRSTLVR